MKKFKELKLMVEEKKDKYDEGEYDQEGDMAKSDLRSIMANAKELHDMIDDADNLPEWCQNKITLAEDYISTVANYLTAEMNEGAIPAKEKTVTVKHKTSGKELVVTAQKAKELKQHDYHPVKEEVSKADVPAYLRKQKGEKPLTMADVKAPRKDSISAKENLAKARNEEVEQIDELSNTTLKSYMKNKKEVEGSGGGRMGSGYSYDKSEEGTRSAIRRLQARKNQIGKYGDIPKVPGYNKEEVEQIGEGIEVKKEYNDKTEAEHGVYHNGKKIGYVVHHKPSGTHTAYHSPQDDDDYGQIDDFRSHHDAVSQIRHSAGVGVHEEVEQIDEKNVPTSPEKWAQAKAQAKAKFDVYPSAYANGWAAKKYKAMGGGWKSVSEAKEEPPFDKPYTTVKKVVTDKSGAKHNPMSRARDIARMAMKKQMEKMKPVKESLEESRKAEIVKEIMKKKKDKSEDAFQKDPELTTTLTKVI